MTSVSSPAAAPPLTGFFPLQRVAVSLLFLMNGFLVGSWAPKIPEFAKAHGLSEGQLGMMIIGFGLGSVGAMPWIGRAVVRSGSRGVLLGLAAAAAVALLAITLAPSVPVAALAVLFFGATAGGMDVAMNANAVSVEKAMGRAIMSSCHGFWSLGGLMGAAAGGPLIANLGILMHVVLVTAIAGALVTIAWPLVMNDAGPTSAEPAKTQLPRQLLPWLVGILALFSMIPEGAVMDWGALYFRKELGASISESGLAFAAFSATMAIMRFAGDAVRDRFGAVNTFRACAVISIIGMVMAGMAPAPAWAIAGFAICGIGISNLIPIAFSAAGNLPGLAPGIGIALVTLMGYSGGLFAPTFLGFVAEYTSFAWIFTVLPVLLLVALALSHLARYGDIQQNS